MKGNGKTKRNSQQTLKAKGVFDWASVRQRITEASLKLENLEETSPEVLEQVWSRRAERLARVPAKVDEGEKIRLVMLRLGREVYGVDVQHVFDIRLVEAITRVPRVPDWVAGVVNRRGHIFSVVDLQRYLGLPRQEAATPNGHTPLNAQDGRCLVVVETPDMELALLADEVLPLEEISVGQIQEATAIIRGIRPEYLRGVAERKSGDSLVVLDLLALLADKQLIVHEEIV